MRAMSDKEESQKQHILAIESKYHADLAAHSAELPNAGAQAMHRVRSLVAAVNELEQRLAQTKERERETQKRLQADADMAYTQSYFRGTPTFVRLPPDRWPQEWRDRGMVDPVCPMAP